MTPEQKIGGWGRLAIVFGIVLSIVWVGAMLYRGTERAHVQMLAIADDAKRTCEERRRTALGSGGASTLRLRSVGVTLPTS
jgi:hypothetical protein